MSRRSSSSTLARALILWGVLVFVVWNVTFDRATRAEAQAFASHQMNRYARGLPVVSITAGFRPRVRRAALRSSVWAAALVAAGLAAVAAARRVS